MTIEESVARYHEALHAMQSGVATEMGVDPKPTEPKHLRVGINSALVNNEAIATLLIEKGIITQEEYTEQVAISMEKEKKSYEQRLSQYFPGQNIVLH